MKFFSLLLASLVTVSISISAANAETTKSTKKAKPAATAKTTERVPVPFVPQTTKVTAKSTTKASKGKTTKAKTTAKPKAAAVPAVVKDPDPAPEAEDTKELDTSNEVSENIAPTPAAIPVVEEEIKEVSAPPPPTPTKVKGTKVQTAKAQPAATTKTAPIKTARGEVYHWVGPDGRDYFGSSPDKNAVRVSAVKKSSISRYSSDKALKSLKKSVGGSVGESNLIGDTVTTKETKLASAKAGKAIATEKTARASLDTKATPDLPPQDDQDLVGRSLISQNLHTSYDNDGRLTDCSVELTNNSSVPVTKFSINFEFPDGTTVPGSGPEVVDPGSTVIYELSRAVLPLAFGATGESNPKPKVNISYQ